MAAGDGKSLKQILALTGGVNSRIFALVKDLSIFADLRGAVSPKSFGTQFGGRIIDNFCDVVAARA